MTNFFQAVCKLHLPLRFKWLVYLAQLKTRRCNILTVLVPFVIKSLPSWAAKWIDDHTSASSLNSGVSMWMLTCPGTFAKARRKSSYNIRGKMRRWYFPWSTTRLLKVDAGTSKLWGSWQYTTICTNMIVLSIVRRNNCMRTWSCYVDMSALLSRWCDQSLSAAARPLYGSTPIADKTLHLNSTNSLGISHVGW